MIENQSRIKGRNLCLYRTSTGINSWSTGPILVLNSHFWTSLVTVINLKEEWIENVRDTSHSLLTTMIIIFGSWLRTSLSHILPWISRLFVTERIILIINSSVGTSMNSVYRYSINIFMKLYGQWMRRGHQQVRHKSFVM